MEKLLCQTQHYDWGSQDSFCTVAKFNKKHTVCSAYPPYAEFWMGTHPQAPSTIIRTNEVLQPTLPFLFKFLSVSKALSIQVHPSKELARILNTNYPNIYKDGNHKPEMAIALTKLELLYGFNDDWESILKRYPEIPQVSSLKNLVEFLLTDLNVHEIYAKVLHRLQNSNGLFDTDKLFLSLCEQHPEDTGALLAVFMNYTILEPHEAISIDANIPHAYLKGDLVECMASSDNVIRVGLTNKIKDIAALLCCVSYDTNPALIRYPMNQGDCCRLYKSGFEEFDVAYVLPISQLTTSSTAIIANMNTHDVHFLPQNASMEVVDPSWIAFYPGGLTVDKIF